LGEEEENSMLCFLREYFQGKYLPYRMNRLEYQMASFDSALAALAAKVDAVVAVIANDAVALEAARQAVADANARAEQVVAEDAAGDAAVDSARADALAEVGAKLDAVLNPPVAVDVPVEDAPQV
jgi:hypothetical protein